MLGEVAAVLLVLGILALVFGVISKVRVKRLMDAPLVSTGDASMRGAEVANAKGSIAVEGQLLVQQPLVSPVTGKPCLYYHLNVTSSRTIGDRTVESKIEDSGVAAQFAIDDGSGGVWIDAAKGGDNDDEVETKMSHKIGLIGGLTDKPVTFGNYTIKAGLLEIGTTYDVVETVWPLPSSAQLYVCGVTSGNAITSPNWRSLIVSGKSRDALLGAASRNAKFSLFGGGIASGLGTVLGILGLTVFASPKADATSTTTVSAASTHTTSSVESMPSKTSSVHVETLPVAKPRTGTKRK